MIFLFKWYFLDEALKDYFFSPLKTFFFIQLLHIAIMLSFMGYLPFTMRAWICLSVVESCSWGILKLMSFMLFFLLDFIILSATDLMGNILKCNWMQNMACNIREANEYNSFLTAKINAFYNFIFLINFLCIYINCSDFFLCCFFYLLRNGIVKWLCDLFDCANRLRKIWLRRTAFTLLIWQFKAPRATLISLMILTLMSYFYRTPSFLL